MRRSSFLHSALETDGLRLPNFRGLTSRVSEIWGLAHPSPILKPPLPARRLRRLDLCAFVALFYGPPLSYQRFAPAFGVINESANYNKSLRVANAGNLTAVFIQRIRFNR